MILRNIYTNDLTTGEKLWSGIQLLKLAKPRRHHFYVPQVETLKTRGFLKLTDTELTLLTVDGPMRFSIDHGPGCYCLHCGEEIPYEWNAPAGSPDRGRQAREHVATHHAGAESPNPSYPNGYKLKNYYGVTARDDVPDVHPQAVGILRRMQAMRGEA